MSIITPFKKGKDRKIYTHRLDTELKEGDDYHHQGQKILLECLKPKLKCDMAKQTKIMKPV